MRWLLELFRGHEPGIPEELSPKARKLYELLKQRESRTESELARELGVSRPTLVKHLKELRAKGLIEWQRRGRRANAYVLDVKMALHQAREGSSGRSESRGEGKEALPLGGLDVKSALHQAAEGRFNVQAPSHQATEGLFGRRGELRRLKQWLDEGRNVLIVGQEGVGKTALLKALSRLPLVPEPERAFLSVSAPSRVFLLQLAEELRRRGLLELAVENQRNSQLAEAVIKALAGSGKRWLLFLDDLEPTPKQIPVLEALMPYCQIVATSRKVKPGTELFFSTFSWLELGPLDERSCEAIVDGYVAAHYEPAALPPQNQALLKRQVIQAAKGNPKRLLGLLERLSLHEGVVDSQVLEEELAAGPQPQQGYYDLRPLVVLAFAVAIAIRYIGIGLEREEVYVLGGVATALFLALRWYLIYWQGRRARQR